MDSGYRDPSRAAHDFREAVREVLTAAGVPLPSRPQPPARVTLAPKSALEVGLKFVGYAQRQVLIADRTTVVNAIRSAGLQIAFESDDDDAGAMVTRSVDATITAERTEAIQSWLGLLAMRAHHADDEPTTWGEVAAWLNACQAQDDVLPARDWRAP